MVWLLACSGPQAVAEPSPWAQEVARHDLAIDQARSSFEDSGSRLQLQLAAGHHRQRARLTGEWSDYEQCQELLAQAFELAPEGAGPWLMQAQLDYGLHRFERVESSLSRVEAAVVVDDPTRASVALLRSDLARQAGDLPLSESLLVEAEELQPSMSVDLSWALLAWERGQLDEAERRLDAAEQRYHGRWSEPLAWLELQRFDLDQERGQLEAAEAHLEASEDHLGGWWLVTQHLAELRALQGRTEEARRLYAEVLEQAESQEALDALAELEPDPAQAQVWALRAGALREAHAALFPEAAAGHVH
jgi:tetratricopeptide (TPR) repeat protein